jgi:hypothetical protein
LDVFRLTFIVYETRCCQRRSCDTADENKKSATNKVGAFIGEVIIFRKVFKTAGSANELHFEIARNCERDKTAVRKVEQFTRERLRKVVGIACEECPVVPRQRDRR